tara:strand:- start:18741 stop:19370 length:630 start_codon:yes stop_codon:yes gene_type:complete
MNRLKIAAAVAMIGLVFGSCNQSNPESTEGSQEQIKTKPVEAPAAAKKMMTVVMVNSDTLMSQYAYAEVLRDQLTTATLKYEGILRQKESKLRADAAKLQSEAASLSQFEGQNRQRKLYEAQDQLQQTQEEYSRKLMEMEQGFNRDIHNAINEYLGRYCADKPYEMVLSNSDLGIIRWADKSLDITNEVLSGLNQEYAENTADQVTEEK